jgi:hypothetical protein
MELVPAHTAVTMPFPSTVTTWIFEDVYVRYEDRLASSTVPSENVAKIGRGVVWVGVAKAIVDIEGLMPIGKSARSTSTVTEVDLASWPPTVVPSAVRRYLPRAMSDGIEMVNCAGTEVATSLLPIGFCPITST